MTKKNQETKRGKSKQGNSGEEKTKARNETKEGGGRSNLAKFEQRKTRKPSYQKRKKAKKKVGRVNRQN